MVSGVVPATDAADHAPGTASAPAPIPPLFKCSRRPSLCLDKCPISRLVAFPLVHLHDANSSRCLDPSNWGLATLGAPELGRSPTAPNLPRQSLWKRRPRAGRASRRWGTQLANDLRALSPGRMEYSPPRTLTNPGNPVRCLRIGLAGMVKPPVPSLLPTRGAFSAPRPTKSPLLIHTCCTNSNWRVRLAPMKMNTTPRSTPWSLSTPSGSTGPYDGPRRSTRWIFVLTIVSRRPSLGLTRLMCDPSGPISPFGPDSKYRKSLLRVQSWPTRGRPFQVPTLAALRSASGPTILAATSSSSSWERALARRKRRNAATSVWS